MRLFPPVYLFGREALNDMSLGGYSIRRGDTVLMSQWLMHRDPRFFAQPEVFDPERWSAEFERTLPHYAYFPFGGGPRICVGRDVALVEAAVILATLTRQFGVSLNSSEEVAPWPTVTLRPPGAVWATAALSGVGANNH